MWTSLVVGLVCLLLAAGPAEAQTPSPEDTLTSFSAVQRAVRAWGAIPESEKLPTPAGACVMLKLRGEVVGRGMAWTVGAAEPPKGGVIREALAAAMKQAEPRLGVPNDAMRDDAIREIAKGILIGVELAGSLSAIEPGTWEDAESSLRPGLDGVAVRNGDGKGAIVGVFPSQMMLTNVLPHRALGGAVAQSLGEGGAAAALDEPKKIREKHGLRMCSFRVGHAVQGSVDGPPLMLFRGGRLLSSDTPISVQSLREMATSLARHLASQTRPDPVVERRIQLPPGATHLAASDALAAYALAEYHDLCDRVARREGIALPIMHGAVNSLFQRASNRARPDRDSLSAAMIYLAQARVTYAQDCTAEERANERSEEWSTYLHEVLDSPERFKAVPFPIRAAAACAITPERGLPLTDRPRPDPKPWFDASVRRAKLGWEGLEESHVVSTMPWLGWGQVKLERFIREYENPPPPGRARSESQLDRVAPPRDLPMAVAFRHMRDQCWKHQLTPTQATDDTLDMIGGIVFTAGVGEGGSNPYPTWQCVRPLAFIATMLGDPRLTEPGERMKEIPNLMLAMRYLRQLQVDDASAWMYPNPELAKGGIRAAVWDNSQPTDATSLTLLCVVELLKSIDKLAAQPAAETPAPPTK